MAPYLFAVLVAALVYISCELGNRLVRQLTACVLVFGCCKSLRCASRNACCRSQCDRHHDSSHRSAGCERRSKRARILGLRRFRTRGKTQRGGICRFGGHARARVFRDPGYEQAARRVFSGESHPVTRLAAIRYSTNLGVERRY
jgi:hypothetical protein